MKPKKRSFPSNKRVAAASIASTFQLQEQRRELIYSCLAFFLKLGLLSLGAVSLIKLSFAYSQRLVRHSELAAVLEVESLKLNSLNKRFDHLFTIGGGHRLMDEQDQLIAPNRLRVIWK